MDKLIIIPAYKPDDRLTEVCRALSATYPVLVIDDGSGKEFDRVFENTSEFATVLRYEVNRGKGGALKYAYSRTEELFPDINYIITADADGQHTAQDIAKVATEVEAHGGLVLGSREFTGEIPLRSRFGNTLTRWVFRFASGVKVRDTQTGLRAFGKEYLGEFASLKGDRYEYEMTQLMYCAEKNIEIHEVTIETIYENENETSHFNPLWDSLKIYRIIYLNSPILKYITSSVIAFIIYYVMVLLLTNFIFTGEVLFEKPEFLRKVLTPVDLATGISWIVSSFTNFLLNKYFAFRSKNKFLPALGEYYSLAAVSFAVKNFVLLKLFYEVIGIPLWIAVPISELGMYIVNYIVQKKFIFKKQSKKD